MKIYEKPNIVYLSEVSNPSILQQKQDLIRILDYVEKPYKVIIEIRENLEDRPARTQMIKDLIDKKYNELFTFSILTLYNSVSEFIHTTKYLMDKKVPFNYYADKFSFDFVRLPLINAMSDLYIRETIKKVETDDFIIEDFNCLGTCKRKNDEPHEV